MDSNLSARILSEVRQEREKRAGAIPAIQEAATAGLKQEALKDIGRVALWSAGLGMAGRGGYGLLNMLRRDLARQKGSPQIAPMPLPVEMEEEEEEPELAKAAGYLTDLFAGSKATSKEGIPWYTPAMLTGGLAAGYGGWRAVDAILDQKRRQEVKQELKEEREKFRQAMLSQFDEPVDASKVAGDDRFVKLAKDLDRLYDLMMEKRALLGINSENIGKGLGMYGYYAVPSALLAGWAAWSAAKKRRRKNVLEKALLRRKQRRQAVRPPEIFATPVPVQMPKEEEETV